VSETEVDGRGRPLGSRAGKGDVYLFLALGLGSASSYVFHLLMTRIMGPSDYGALGGLLTVLLVIGVPVAGVQAVVARRIAVHRETHGTYRSEVVRSALRGALLTGGLLAAAMAVSASWAAGYLRTGSAAPILLLAVLLLPSFITPVGRGALQGLVRFRALGTGILIHGVLRVTLGTLLAVAWGLPGAVLGLLLAEVAGMLLALAPLRGAGREERPAGAAASKLLPETLGASAALLGLWVLATIDVALVRHYLPAGHSGRYAAVALVGKAVLFAATAVAMVAYPRFAAGGDVARRALRSAMRAAMGLGALATVTVALFPGLIAATLGDAYGTTGALAPLLGIAGTGFGAAAVVLYHQMARGRVRLFPLWLLIPVEIAAVVSLHATPTTVALIVAVTGWCVAAIVWVQQSKSLTAARQVPKGELWLRHAGGTVLSVITPTYNGEGTLGANLRRLLAALREARLRYEVIVVSDGSTDGTVAAAREYAPEGVRLLHYEKNQGKGHALKTGLARASGRYVALIDSDGDLDPGDLVRFLTLMELYEADVVVGSKRHPLSEVSYPLSRRTLSWIYQKLIRLLFRVRVRDTQAGIKLIRRDVLAKVLPLLVEKRFAFDLELLVAARRMGYRRIMEAPIHLSYRFTSTVSRRDMVAMATDTLRVWYRRFIARAYDPTPPDGFVLPDPRPKPVLVGAVEGAPGGD